MCITWVWFAVSCYPLWCWKARTHLEGALGISGCCCRYWYFNHLDSAADDRQCDIFLFNAPSYRSLRSHWDSAAEPAKPPVPGLNFLTLLGLFYSVVPCALSLKGALKMLKKKLEQPVSSHCISNTLFHVVCCCLFILVCRIYIDVLNIENLLIYPLH